MVDNIAVTPGTGLTVAADDVGGVLFQRVKIGIGVDGTAADLAYGQQAKGLSLPVTMAIDQDPIITKPISRGYDATAAFNRPTNVTAYTAVDVIGPTTNAVLTFANVGPAGGSTVSITGAQLEIDVAAIPSGMTTFRLYLYNSIPTSPYTDNTGWDLGATDRPKFLGYIDLGTPLDLGSTLYVETNNINKQVLLSSNNVYGYLVTAGAFTPANNSEAYSITLHTVVL